MQKQIVKCCGKCHTNYWCQYHAIERQGKLIIANLVHGWVAPLWDWHKASLSDISVSWPDLDLVRPVGAGECDLRLDVPRQC